MLATLYWAVLLMMLVVSVVTTILIGAGAAAIFLVKAPYAPTPTKHLKKILELFDLKLGDKFYDLGCGDGRLVLAAANVGAEAVGFEMSVWAFTKATLKNIFAKQKGKFYFKNFYPVNLADASAVFCFLIDKVMNRVEDKLTKELKPGVKVICYGFSLPTWTPSHIIDPQPENPTGSKIYLYIKK